MLRLQLPDHSAENEKKVHASVAENDKKVHASVAEIAKWANEDVIWLDRIYALEQGILPAEDMALGQLTASSALFAVDNSN